MPAHVPQSHHGSFHSMSPVSSVQHWQNQEVVIADKAFPYFNFTRAIFFNLYLLSLSLLSLFSLTYRLHQKLHKYQLTTSINHP